MIIHVVSFYLNGFFRTGTYLAREPAVSGGAVLGPPAAGSSKFQLLLCRSANQANHNHLSGRYRRHRSRCGGLMLFTSAYPGILHQNSYLSLAPPPAI